MARKRKSLASSAPQQQQQQQQPDPSPYEEQQPIIEQEQAQQIEEQQIEQEEPEQVIEEKEPDNMEEDPENDEETEEQDADETEVAAPLQKPEINGDGEEKEQEEVEEENGDGEEEEEQGDDDDEEEEAEGEDEPTEKLLEPFSKDQLVLLLKEALTKYPELMQNVEKLADLDPAHRKIFVHGFGWDTTAETLTSVFGKYGEIEDCKAVTDKVSGKSKGYGFILFKHRSGARKALKQPQKKIGNRMTSCQLASAGPVPAPPPTITAAPPVSEYTQRKIFVSNVAADLDPKKLLEFFEKFGEVEDGPLGLDKQTGKPKGFALFVYKSVESAKKALEEPHKTYEGHTLHVQKAIDGPKPIKQQNYYHQNQQYQHGHGRGHYQHHQAKKGKYSSGGGSGSGHLMAPSGPPAVGYNPGVAAPGLNPALGQALTAFLATQGAGLGISNFLGGGIGGTVNQGVQPVMSNAAVGYGNQGGGGYGSQMGMQGGYQNPQMGQGGNRPQQGGPPYMGRGH